MMKILYDLNLKDNKEILDDIANTLIEEEKINGLALIDIINKKKPELVPADAIAKLKELQRIQTILRKFC